MSLKKTGKAVLFLLLPAYAQAAEVSPTTSSVLARAMDFEKDMKTAVFRFEEEFTLLITSESESIKGRVYLDQDRSRVRVDYSGPVRARVWIDSSTVFFADDSLKQVVVRDLKEFQEVHLQAFMDIPLIRGMESFKKNFRFALLSSSKESVELGAYPASGAPYHLKLRFNPESGEPKGLDLVLDNYKAVLEISHMEKNAKIKESLFERKFSPDYVYLDLRPKPKSKP